MGADLQRPGRRGRPPSLPLSLSPLLGGNGLRFTQGSQPLNPGVTETPQLHGDAALKDKQCKEENAPEAAAESRVKAAFKKCFPVHTLVKLFRNFTETKHRFLESDLSSSRALRSESALRLTQKRLRGLQQRGERRAGTQIKVNQQNTDTHTHTRALLVFRPGQNVASIWEL